MMRGVKFLAAGGLAAAVEYVIFVILHNALGYQWVFVSQTTSFLCGFIVSFLLNKSWVFASKSNSKQQLLRYSLLALANLILSNALVWLFVNQVGIHYLFVKLVVMVMIAGWNYVIFSRLIFINKSNR